MGVGCGVWGVGCGCGCGWWGEQRKTGLVQCHVVDDVALVVDVGRRLPGAEAVDRRLALHQHRALDHVGRLGRGRD